MSAEGRSEFLSAGPFRGGVVFDCNVFAQALMNRNRPAGRRYRAVLFGEVRLYLAEFVLREIRELPSKLPPRFGVTPERVEELIQNALVVAISVGDVQSSRGWTRDPKDDAYVELAIATGAMLIVSRDSDLLDLMLEGNSNGRFLRGNTHRFAS